MDMNGFHGNTFSDGFGDFFISRKRKADLLSSKWNESYNSFYPRYKAKANMGQVRISDIFPQPSIIATIMVRGGLTWTTMDLTEGQAGQETCTEHSYQIERPCKGPDNSGKWEDRKRD